MDSKEQEWIKKQGPCCITGCNERATCVDSLDNVFCDECADDNREEEPENWWEEAESNHIDDFLNKIAAMAGNPDPAEACRLIIKTIQQYKGGADD